MSAVAARTDRLLLANAIMGQFLTGVATRIFIISLPTIARHAFASASTVLRHFRDEIGTSPHAYLKTRRLEEARRLLETGTGAVGDVALLVGYENFAAFTTAFTRHFGAPPSSFRAGRRS